MKYLVNIDYDDWLSSEDWEYFTQEEFVMALNDADSDIIDWVLDARGKTEVYELLPEHEVVKLFIDYNLPYYPDLINSETIQSLDDVLYFDEKHDADCLHSFLYYELPEYIVNEESILEGLDFYATSFHESTTDYLIDLVKFEKEVSTSLEKYLEGVKFALNNIGYYNVLVTKLDDSGNIIDTDGLSYGSFGYNKLTFREMQEFVLNVYDYLEGEDEIFVDSNSQALEYVDKASVKIVDVDATSYKFTEK